MYQYMHTRTAIYVSVAGASFSLVENPGGYLAPRR